jgi:7-cyano-7-deazaguanine synthase
MEKKSALKALIIHSGGMDSSLCLAMAIQEFGSDAVISLGFDYGQRHEVELMAAQKIADYFKVKRMVIQIPFYQNVTKSALLDKSEEIKKLPNNIPNTMVLGRNGLMGQIAGIYANSLGIKKIYMGVMELESSNSGYRDCSRQYMDQLQGLLRMDFADESFEIKTPVINYTKMETMELADQLGVLNFLLEETITCYNGIKNIGCQSCPACLLRNDGIKNFYLSHKEKIPSAPDWVTTKLLS